MNKINWKQKLSSRKLWAAVAGVLCALIGVLCGESLTPETAEALRVGVLAVVAYIFGEGAVDVARAIADAISGKDEAAGKKTEI